LNPDRRKEAHSKLACPNHNKDIRSSGYQDTGYKEIRVSGDNEPDVLIPWYPLPDTLII